LAILPEVPSSHKPGRACHKYWCRSSWDSP
jgi:hypothetical protein